MNKLFYKIFPRILPFISLNKLIYLTNRKLICPFYHVISDNDLFHIKHLYKIRNQKEFERDIDFFLKNYRPIDFNKLTDYINNGKEVTENSFFLSFDDGLREFHDIIAPILLRKGIPAVCFLNTDFIDNKDLFFRYKASLLIEIINKRKLSGTEKNKISEKLIEKNISKKGKTYDILKINYNERFIIDELAKIINYDFNEYLIQNEPYLNSEQITNLIKKGFHFGAHSIDHPEFFRLSLEDQIYQTRSSIEKICRTFNLDYKLFSFPFTDFGITQQYFDTIKKNHISDLTFGCAGLKKDSIKNNIQRIPMEICDLSAKDIITAEYFYYVCKTLINKNIIKRY